MSPPLPTSILTKLSKTLRAFSSVTSPSLCHNLSGSVLFNHSHRTLRATPCSIKFFIPKPSPLVGQHTSSQATKQFPPLVDFFPDQKKDLIHLLISSNTHLGASMIRR